MITDNTSLFSALLGFSLAQISALGAGALLFGALRWRLPVGLFVPTAWLVGTGLLAAERLLLAQMGLPWTPLTIGMPWLLLAIPVIWRFSLLVTHYSVLGARLHRLRTSKTPQDQQALVPVIELAVALIIILWSLALFKRTLSEPLDGWDALLIWVFKGRVMHHTGTVPVGFFTDPHYAVVGHLDYPLLVPLTVARIYSWIGDQEVVVKGWWSLLAGAGVAGIYYGLAGLIGRAARLGGLVLVIGTPAMILYGADGLAGYAELPMAVFFLYAALFLYRWLRNRAPEELGLSAIFFGMPGFTKNEGLVLTIAGLGLLLWIALFRRQLGRPEFWIGLFVAGLIALPWQIEIRVLDIQGDLHPTITGIIANWQERLGPILTSMTRDVSNTSVVSVIWLLLPLLSLAVLLFTPRRWLAISPALLLVLVHLLATIAAYITTPYDLRWHLGTSADRLVFQATLVAALLGTIYVGTLLDRTELSATAREEQEPVSDLPKVIRQKRAAQCGQPFTPNEQQP